VEATAIQFPNLHVYLNNVPKGFSIGGFEIAIYGIMIALGMFLGFSFAAYAAKKDGHNPDIIWDFAVPAIFFSICGARLYYVAMSWEHYKDNPISVLYLRQGGLAIYGGVIAGFTAMYVYTRSGRRGDTLKPHRMYRYTYDALGHLTTRTTYVWHRHRGWQPAGRLDYTFSTTDYCVSYSRWNRGAAQFDAPIDKMTYTLLPNAAVNSISCYHRDRPADAFALAFAVNVTDLPFYPDSLLSQHSR